MMRVRSIAEKVEKNLKKSPVKLVSAPLPEESAIPIKYWSHSSLMSFLRNPLAWYKRYVEHIYDNPANPASIIGRAAHTALQHFYQSRIVSKPKTFTSSVSSDADCKDEAFPGGLSKEGSIELGLEYLRSVADFEINFGKARSRAAQKKKRQEMERDYLQAISFYLIRPPKYDVLGVEVSALAQVDGLPIPIKAISDLVVYSKGNPGALDIVDHKFVDSFSKNAEYKTLFLMQAIFNYYTVTHMYGKPVRRFIVHECKKRRNADGSSQMRKYVIDFQKCEEDFAVFHRLIKDATEEISRRRIYLPNPSDMFEGENSFDIYRMGLVE